MSGLILNIISISRLDLQIKCAFFIRGMQTGRNTHMQNEIMWICTVGLGHEGSVITISPPHCVNAYTDHELEGNRNRTKGEHFDLNIFTFLLKASYF